MGILISFNLSHAVNETDTVNNLEQTDDTSPPPAQEKSDSGTETNTSEANTTLNKTYSIQSSTSTTVKSQYLNSKGYWVWSSYANSVNIASLKKQGFTDIYILTKGSSGEINYSALSTIINKAKEVE